MSFPSGLILSLALGGAILPKIIGGERVAPEDEIAHTTIGAERDGKNCSGSIIANHLAITACHCGDITQVNFGTDLNESHESRRVIARELHPFCFNGGYHDFQILRYEGEMPTGFHPVALARDASHSQAGTTLVSAGFGRPMRGMLYKTRLTVTNEESSGSSDAYVVDGRHGTGICFGDSGGPSLFEGPLGYELVGGHTSVSSGSCDGWGYITDIYANLQWIHEATRRLGE
jgi:hypothetical protein